MKKYVCLFFLMLYTGCGEQSTSIKVATYNIYWLDDGILEARKMRLQAVIRELNADIIGFQEIQSRAALENILPEGYDIGMIDDAEELQEVALAVRKPFVLRDVKMVFPEDVYDQAFPKKRDLLEARVEGYGHLFTVFVHHAKSRSGGRLQTDIQREQAAELMMRYLSSRIKHDRILVLGDFNDNPDDRSLNILEYGDAATPGGVDNKPDTFLFNVTEDLLNRDVCSYGYNYLYEKIETPTFDPVVKGARDENNLWRGKPHDFMNDVKIKTILFDQILVSLNLKEYVQDVGVFDRASAVAGERSSVHFQGDQLIYTKRGDFASDHVPVWAVLKF
jgi:endonuclease/exonuclease/phosphatase family metal-dependent hydrolase